MRLVGLILSVMLAASCAAKVVYMSAGGSDAGDGSIKRPYATLPVALRAIEGGDTVCVRGGRYYVDDSQVMKTQGAYAYVFALEKAGTAKHRTCIMGYPGERPVFDFSALQMEGKFRFAAFYLGADYLHLRNFDIVGVPVRIKGHTQSECVSARKGSYCIVENLAMHDNMAIGYYQLFGEYNLVLNCDAYNNYDDYSEDEYGGNVDGFGCHIRNMEQKGNAFRYCRAWRNSDDGFDLINCDTPVEFDHCWAFYNGFRPTENPTDTIQFVNAGDGNGFKAGGFGMGTKTKCPPMCPTHFIHDCLAYKNKANGMYANHHLTGNRWENNVSAMNRRDNYNMVNRKSPGADGNVDVSGYDHVLINNVSYKPGKQHISNVDQNSSTLTGNSFQKTGTLRAEDFLTTQESLLFVPRDADGWLPVTKLFKLRQESWLNQQ